MTKSQHNATTPMIFNFVKILAVLCIVKVVVISLYLCKIPIPDWFMQSTLIKEQNSATSVADANLKGDLEPQGREAALLAMEKQAPNRSRKGLLDLPVPELKSADKSPAFIDETIAAMPPLEAPKISLLPEKPKVMTAIYKENLLQATGRSSSTRGANWFDMFSLESLPVPLLGSVSVAYAASNSMPAPTVRPAPDLFSPAEQKMPYGFDSNAVGNINRNQAIPPRGDATTPNLPGTKGANNMPTPTIAPSNNSRDMVDSNRAQDIARQESDILMLRQQMDQRFKDMEGAEQRMHDLLREARALEDKKMRSLILMYSNMKPKAAAKALESMEDRIAVRILSGMPPKQAGEILTYTTPDKTAAFSELITRMRSVD